MKLKESDISGLQHKFYIAIYDFAKSPEIELKITFFSEAREIQNSNARIISALLSKKTARKTTWN